MEKLIELHRQFLEETGKSMTIYSDGKLWYFYCLDTTYDHTEGAIQYLISKEYGFIKRLVENDKIDLDKVKDKTIVKEVYEDYNSDLGMSADFYSIYESLLMLLSISDTPIEDLISYLK